jgi:hypothetical protein
MMSDQFRDDGEDLRLDADTFVAAPEFGTTSVEDEVVEAPRVGVWGVVVVQEFWHGGSPIPIAW